MTRKLKLDENFSPILAELFQAAGYDAHSVVAERLSGAPDELIFETICAEKRILITFYTDTSVISFAFRPKQPRG